MAVIPLTIAQIKDCVKNLVQNAKAKIPEYPKETWNVEHHYVSELFEKEGEQLIFAFKFNPALKKEQMKKMMIWCVVCSPSKGCEFEKPIMYEPVETMIEIIDTEEIVTQCVKAFEVLLQETEDFDPDERDDFFYD